MEVTLTKPAVTELTSVSGPQALFAEWLQAWFDGGSHAVGTNAAVYFPRCNRAFNESEPVQPLYDFKADQPQITFAEIRLVILPRMETASSNANVLYDGKLVEDMVVLQFWVAVKHPGKGQGQYWATTIGQLLKAILANPDARYGLAQKGVTSLQPQPVLPLQSGDYAKCLVSCNARIQYPQGFDASVVPPSVDEQSAGYYNEDPLLVGNELIGSYQWGSNAQILTATVVAWPPQGTSVVLGMAVGGVLNGYQITINPDVPNVNVVIPVVVNLTVPRNQAVTWRVVSAPAPEDSAWHLSLTMQVRPV